MKMSVSVDLSKLKPNMQKRMKKMQVILDTQVIKDSNYYAPQMDDALINSSLIASQIGSGIQLSQLVFPSAQKCGQLCGVAFIAPRQRQPQRQSGIQLG